MWGSTCVCVCVCVCFVVCVLLRHLVVFLWVSLAHTYTNPLPITILSNNLSSRWQIHTHTQQQNQILGLEYLLDLQLSICLLLHMIFKFIAHNSKQQLLLECVVVWGPWKRNLILSGESLLGTLDAKVSFYLHKGPKFGSPQLLLLGTKQWVRHTLSGLAILHSKVP
jgi:hypothetical protein